MNCLEVNNAELSLLSIAVYDLIQDRLSYMKELYNDSSLKCEDIKRIELIQTECVSELFELQFKIDSILNGLV